MNGIVDFFSEYGLISLCVTALSSAAGIAVGKLCKTEKGGKAAKIVATLSAVIAATAADMIFFKKAFALSADALYTGIVCGSLAAAVTAFALKPRDGAISADDAFALLSDLLDGYADGNRKAELLNRLLSAAEVSDDDGLILYASNLIKDNCNAQITDKALAEIAAAAVRLIKKIRKNG